MSIQSFIYDPLTTSNNGSVRFRISIKSSYMHIAIFLDIFEVCGNNRFRNNASI